jgi:hypothetical protein
MAFIHGSTQTEKTLLEICPSFISRFEDIESHCIGLKRELSIKRRKFFRELPNEIKKNKRSLKNLHQKRLETQKIYEQNIQNSRTRLKQIYLSKISWPFAIKSHNKKIQLKEIEIELLNNEPDAVFDELNNEILETLANMREISISQNYFAAFGENEVLKELRKLDDNFHVFCDLKVQLPGFIRYRGEKNLGSAQMDFVVVGRTGVFVIEVKNWKNEFFQNEGVFSPHEQVDRAGLVLYIFLNNFLPFKPNVSRVLLPIQQNLSYDSNFKYVSVVNLEHLNSFIRSKEKHLTDTEIEDVSLLLKRGVRYR